MAANKGETFLVNLLYRESGFNKAKSTINEFKNSIKGVRGVYSDLYLTNRNMIQGFGLTDRMFANASARAHDFAQKIKDLSILHNKFNSGQITQTTFTNQKGNIVNTLSNAQQWAMQSPSHMAFFQQIEGIKANFIQNLTRGLSSISNGILKVAMTIAGGGLMLGGAAITTAAGIGVIGAGYVGHKLYSTRLNLVSRQLALKGMYGQEKGKELFKWSMYDFMGGRAPFDVSDITEAVTKSKAYGWSEGQMKKILPQLAGAAAAFGRTLDNAMEMMADLLMGQFRERTKSYGISQEMIVAEAHGMDVQQYVQLPFAQRKKMGQDVGLIPIGQSGQWKVLPEKRFGPFQEAVLGLMEKRFGGIMPEFQKGLPGLQAVTKRAWTSFWWESGENRPGTVMQAFEKDFGNIGDKLTKMLTSGEMAKIGEAVGTALRDYIYDPVKKALSSVFGDINLADIMNLDFKGIWGKMTPGLSFLWGELKGWFKKQWDSINWGWVGTEIVKVIKATLTQAYGAFRELPGLLQGVLGGAIGGKVLSDYVAPLSNTLFTGIMTAQMAKGVFKDWRKGKKTTTQAKATKVAEAFAQVEADIAATKAASSSGYTPYQKDMFGGQRGFSKLGTMAGVGGLGLAALLFGPDLYNSAFAANPNPSPGTRFKSNKFHYNEQQALIAEEEDLYKQIRESSSANDPYANNRFYSQGTNWNLPHGMDKTWKYESSGYRDIFSGADLSSKGVKVGKDMGKTFVSVISQALPALFLFMGNKPWLTRSAIGAGVAATVGATSAAITTYANSGIDIANQGAEALDTKLLESDLQSLGKGKTIPSFSSYFMSNAFNKEGPLFSFGKNWYSVPNSYTNKKMLNSQVDQMNFLSQMQSMRGQIDAQLKYEGVIDETGNLSNDRSSRLPPFQKVEMEPRFKLSSIYDIYGKPNLRKKTAMDLMNLRQSGNKWSSVGMTESIYYAWHDPKLQNQLKDLSKITVPEEIADDPEKSRLYRNLIKQQWGEMGALVSNRENFIGGVGSMAPNPYSDSQLYKNVQSKYDKKLRELYPSSGQMKNSEGEKLPLEEYQSAVSDSIDKAINTDIKNGLIKVWDGLRNIAKAIKYEVGDQSNPVTQPAMKENLQAQ